jgi:lactate dehydrogenase-like 2-hydroxyacid dehydrogenase
MKIVILEGATVGVDVDLSTLEELGEVVVYEHTTNENANERIKDAEVVLTNKVHMNERTLSGALNLRLICSTGTGTNHIDGEYARKRGIAVANVKDYSTASVTQHTFAMLFYLLEDLKHYDKFVKSGEYTKGPVFAEFIEKFSEIQGMTWGIIGLGAIGREVAKIAAAFGCKIIYYSTSGKNHNKDYKQVDLDELLRCSDIISIHAPLNDRTRNLITAKELEKMKPTVTLLNVGRGGIIDEEDLYKALKGGIIARAGLDVLAFEPMREGNPLLAIQDSKKLLITPHIAWASIEARTLLIKEIYKNIEAFLRGEERNIVN